MKLLKTVERSTLEYMQNVSFIVFCIVVSFTNLRKAISWQKRTSIYKIYLLQCY